MAYNWEDRFCPVARGIYGHQEARPCAAENSTIQSAIRYNPLHHLKPEGCRLKPVARGA
jgi:hypothetical protein